MTLKNIKWLRLAAVLGLVVLAVLELVARWYGFGNPLLYEAAPSGYRVAPNQSILRFRNHLTYNQFGTRNDPITPLPTSDVTRILCLGDSITYGGSEIDQPASYPARLEQILNSAGKHTEVLNASAGGWAVFNEQRWLHAYGTLGSQIVVLEIGTGDLFQDFAAPDVLDHHPSFPTKKPIFALQEIISRYVMPRLTSAITTDPGASPSMPDAAKFAEVLHAIADIESTVRAANAKLVILYIQQPEELDAKDTVTVFADHQLVQWTTDHSVPLIRPKQALDAGGGKKMFRDGLHPNASGNSIIAAELSKALPL